MTETRHLTTLLAGFVLAGATSPVTAAPFTSFDPRSMAMGGAGVAVANTASAPFFNPSLLAVTPEDDHFAVELPIAGIRAYDPDDFSDSIDDFQDAGLDARLNNLLDRLSSDIDTNNYSALPGDYTDAADATADLNAGLKTLDDKPVQIDGGLATVVGIPNKHFGIAFSASGTLALGGIINYKDAGFLSGVEADMRTIAAAPSCYTNPATCPTDLTYIDTDPGSPTYLEIINSDGTPFDATNDIQSTVNIRGIQLREVALSFAREFSLKGATFAVGVTPKYVKVTVYDYQANANNADDDDVDTDDYAKDYASVNLDIGVAKNYHNGWRTGLVFKNIIRQEYDTYGLNSDTGVVEKTGNSVKLNPQARIGASYQTEFSTVALDIDLTENEPAGFDEKSRYVSLGGEYNLVDWAQIRAGYRINTSESGRNIPSVGIGLSPAGIHFDLAVAANADEIGASAQFGFRF